MYNNSNGTVSSHISTTFNNGTSTLDSVKLVFGILHAVTGVLEMILNGIVLIALCQRNALQKNYNKLSFALSMVHFINGCVTAPLNSFNLLLPDFEKYKLINRIRKSFKSITLSMSTNIVMVIAFDRYMLLSRSTNFVLTGPILNMILFFCFLISFLTTTFLQIFGKGTGFAAGSKFIFVFLVISIFYILILKALNKYQSQITSARVARHERNVSNVVLVILACYVVMNFPFSAVLLIREKFKTNELMKIALMVSAYLHELNSVANPLIYCFGTRTRLEILNFFS